MEFMEVCSQQLFSRVTKTLSERIIEVDLEKSSPTV